ncbi:MAG: ABC transporter substrate-binding protein [Rhodospirillaceae bacterium]|nr:ABC transporter substrate-binding protein [Rhodospirillaceae bacterium]
MTRILALLMMLLAFHTTPAMAQSTRIAITVALPDGPPTRTVGLLIAQRRGYFMEAGLDVTLSPARYGRSPVEALVDNSADLAVEIMPLALVARARGGDVVHVAQFFQRSTLSLMCRKTVDQPMKLAGHNVGVWLDGWESSFYAWLSRLGLSYFATGGGVTIVRQGTDAEIFLENEVDCLTTTSYRAPFALASLGEGRAGLITYSYQDLDLGMLEDGLYARSADLANPAKVDVFARFLTAAARGWQSLQDDPSQAERMILEQSAPDKLDPDSVAESLAAVSKAVAAGTVEIGTLDDAAFDRTVNLLLTGAPEPTLTSAPAGAVSAILRQRP